MPNHEYFHLHTPRRDSFSPDSSSDSLPFLRPHSPGAFSDTSISIPGSPYFEKPSLPPFPSRGTPKNRNKHILLISLTSAITLFTIYALSRSSIPAFTFPKNNQGVKESNATLHPMILEEGRWTLSPPKKLGLSGAAMAKTCQAVQHHLMSSGGGGHKSYYYSDPSFVDPASREQETSDDEDPCGRSLTYTLSSASTPHGLGETVLQITTAMSLAKSENRTFFLDDSNWAWGRWSDYFLPIPATSPVDPSVTCPQPEWKEMLPCPRTARHLVVSWDTRRWVFGHSFSEEFEDPKQQGVMRARTVFDFISEGWQMIKLTGCAQKVVDLGLRELGAAGVKKVKGGIGIAQVRRGDFKPKTWQWRKTEVPADILAEGAYNASLPSHFASTQEEDGKGIIISDDATTFEEPAFDEFETPFPEDSPSASSASTKIVTENGVEEVQQQSAAEKKMQVQRTGYSPEMLLSLKMSERVQLGRRWVAEVKVVEYLLGSQETGEEGEKANGEKGVGKGGVACAAGSATCRLLAVVMGWDQAIVKGRWRDVDGDFGWKGVDW